MKNRIILFLLLGIDALLLTLKTQELSISYYEASILYGEFSFLQLIINSSFYLFGQNDFTLRLPMIVFHLLSALLLYEISKPYLKDSGNRLWLVLVFILLPGVISSAIVVNSAGSIIFFLFLFIFVFQRYHIKYSYPLLSFYVFIEHSFLYLFIALLLYAMYKKDKLFFIFNICLVTISIYLNGTGVYGVPKGHFLDTIGIYSAILTPVIFIYVFYVLYRRFLVKNIDMIWFIASSALIISLVLSFRQRIIIEDFAPYLMVALPLAAQTFYSSYRVRLSQFKKNYKFIFRISLIFLFVNSFMVLFNKEIYLYIKKPKKHFAYDMHIAKELATQLKQRNINCISSNFKMTNRLQFYEIDKCNSTILTEQPLSIALKNSVTVRYKKKLLYQATVTNINK